MPTPFTLETWRNQLIFFKFEPVTKLMSIRDLTSFCIPTGKISSWTLNSCREWKFSQWFSMLINTIICFMTSHRIQDSVHINFAKMPSTTAELTAKLLNPGKTASHNIPHCKTESLLVWNSFCTTLFTSFAQGFEAKSFLSKQESCNDNASANPAFGLGTKAVRAKAGEGERAVYSLLPALGAGELHARMLGGAIWPAVSVGRWMMVTGCFAAPSTVKESKIHSSHQGSKWKLHFPSSVGVFPFGAIQQYQRAHRHQVPLIPTPLVTVTAVR